MAKCTALGCQRKGWRPFAAYRYHGVVSFMLCRKHWIHNRNLHLGNPMVPQWQFKETVV